MKANCVICGAEFEKRHNKKTCGPECARQNNERYQAAYYPRKKRPGPGPIDPFPDVIDRGDFGHWLSGFADGEATFGLRLVYCESRGRGSCVAYFRISLRDDDAETLRLIQAYFGCGRLYHSENARSKIANANPVSIYSVQNVTEIVRSVLPHFDSFPMRAKKRHDYVIWRRGVQLMAEVQGRPTKFRPGWARNRHGGVFPKWTEEERELFRSLSEQLRHQRIYAPADLTPARNSCAATPKSK